MGSEGGVGDAPAVMRDCTLHATDRRVKLGSGGRACAIANGSVLVVGEDWAAVVGADDIQILVCARGHLVNAAEEISSSLVANKTEGRKSAMERLVPWSFGLELHRPAS